MLTRQPCCLTARCLSQAVSTAISAISRARNSTIRRPGRGRPRAASPPHGLATRRRCCPTVRCSSQEEVATALWRARNCTIQPAERGRPPAASLTARSSHTATLLPNGKVLVAGGGDGGAIASAELYDPASGTWTATGSLLTERFDHTATLLPNGKVLVVGGLCTAYIGECGTVRSGKRDLECHRQPRHRTHGHTATLLPNGKVLVAGGYNELGYVLASAELYDPASGTWTATGNLVTRTRWSHRDVAAQWHGACRRRLDTKPSRERGTLP